jgi:hypothetical protein
MSPRELTDREVLDVEADKRLRETLGQRGFKRPKTKTKDKK